MHYTCICVLSRTSGCLLPLPTLSLAPFLLLWLDGVMQIQPCNSIKPVSLSLLLSSLTPLPASIQLSREWRKGPHPLLKSSHSRVPSSSVRPSVKSSTLLHLVWMLSYMRRFFFSFLHVCIFRCRCLMGSRIKMEREGRALKTYTRHARRRRERSRIKVVCSSPPLYVHTAYGCCMFTYSTYW